MSELERLQRWYESHCNGDWEHQYGVEIGTLDNPGWHVTIDLTHTDLEESNFSEVSHMSEDASWFFCKKEGPSFSAAGGPFMLATILKTFLDWAECQSSKS